MAYIEMLRFIDEHENEENKFKTYCIKLMFSGFGKTAQNTGFYTVDNLKKLILFFFHNDWELEIFQVLN